MLPKIIFPTLLLILAFADCPITHYPKRVTIGFIHAQINSNPALHSAPQFYQSSLIEPLLFNKYEVMVGLYGLQTKIDDQIQFDVNAQPLDTSSVRFIVTVTDPSFRWQVLKFNFLVSESSYFFMGIEKVESLQITSIPYSYYISTPIKNEFRTTSNSLIKVFISGLHAVRKQKEKSNYDLQEMIEKIEKLRQYSWNAELINKFKKILRDQTFPSVKITQTAINDNKLSFRIRLSTRVVLQKFSFSFLIFQENTIKYEYVSGNFVASHESISYIDSLQHNGMRIVGLTGLKFVPSNQFTLDISEGTDSLGKMYYYSMVKNMENQYEISYFGIQLIPGLECFDCPQSSYIFQNFCVSSCPFGYALGRNKYSTYECQLCDFTKFKIVKDKKCVCTDRYYEDSTTQQCKPCPVDCLTCDGNRCLTCDTLLLETKRVLTPEGRCVCPQFAYYENRVSQLVSCQPCYYSCWSCFGPFPNQCMTCRNGKSKNPVGFCECDKNYNEDSNGNCLCAFPNTILSNGFCTHTSCKENQDLKNYGTFQRCECLPDATAYKGKCIKCEENRVFDYVTGKCICQSETIEAQGKCQKCKKDQVYSKGQCNCLNGKYKNSQGECIQCANLQYYDKYSQKCQCIFNYYPVGNTCERCTSESNNSNCFDVLFSGESYYV